MRVNRKACRSANVVGAGLLNAELAIAIILLKGAALEGSN